MDDFDQRILEEFKEMQRQMGRMWRSTSLSRMIPMTHESHWQPDVDVYETSDDIIVLMDSAGIDMDHLTITAGKNNLVVQGRRSLPTRENICCVHQLEIEMGCFSRTITFPVSITIPKTTFNCHNGILEIKMPKK